jgi:outer membrane lipoprotein
MKQDALIATLAVVLASTAGCGHVIDKHLRKVADKELTLPQVVPNPQQYHGALVIWGGYVLETQNDASGSALIVLETPLGGGEEPKAREKSRGRFIARTPDLLDPALFEAGRRVTVAGRIVGAEVRPLGQTQYTYPVRPVSRPGRS